MKAILDTNIFVSAVLGGRLSMVLDLWRAERKALGVSDEIVQEYIEVLRRPKFKLSADQVDAIAAFVLLRAEFVAPAKLATAIMAADPDDDLFLFAAEAGSADYLVSGDITCKTWLTTEAYRL